MKKLFFTSDDHFGHKNIIKYCDRPFTDVHEMNKVLIERWNAIVPENGIVYHLGDFAWRTCNVEEIRKRLNGKIHLIRGNHDRGMIKAKHSHMFEWIKDYEEIEIQEIRKKIVLCHYPFRTWNKSHHLSWSLHGHCHGGLSSEGTLRLDVGVDTNNYHPYTLEQIVGILSAREKEREGAKQVGY
jgi:calcineurin-like phosphoesterase family protein